MPNRRNGLLVIALSLVTVLLLGLAISVSAAQKEIKFLAHFRADWVLALRPYLEEYRRLNPDVSVTLVQVPYEEVMVKIAAARAARKPAGDVYFLASPLWLPELAKNGILAIPPQDVLQDITAEEYPQYVIDQVTFGGQVLGYPADFQSYTLNYNKRLFADAGLPGSPETWEEFFAYAQKVTKRDSSGRAQQTGFRPYWAFPQENLHTWLPLLWAYGGDYVTQDGEVLFDSPVGRQTLQMLQDMAQKDMSVDIGWGDEEWLSGKTGMFIAALWLKNTFADGFGDELFDTIGSAPMPSGPAGRYGLCFAGMVAVDSASDKKDEAWEFLRWFMAPPAPDQASPYSQWAAAAMGKGSPRYSDLSAQADLLSDPWTKPYIDALAYSKPEPVFLGADEVRGVLQKQFEEVIFGQKSPEEALAFVAEEARKTIAEKSGQ